MWLFFVFCPLIFSCCISPFVFLVFHLRLFIDKKWRRRLFNLPTYYFLDQSLRLRINFGPLLFIPLSVFQDSTMRACAQRECMRRGLLILFFKIQNTKVPWVEPEEHHKKQPWRIHIVVRGIFFPSSRAMVSICADWKFQSGFLNRAVFLAMCRLSPLLSMLRCMRLAN